MLRSSLKVVTLRVGAHGYSLSPGALRGGDWKRWPAQSEAKFERSVEERLASLDLPEARTCSTLDVVVDIGLTRMQIVRFPVGIRKPDERATFLKAVFRNVFGREASDWHIVADPVYVYEPTPAIAIDDKLMQAITAFGERHGLKLRSLRTSFADCFNSLRRKLSAHMGGFVMLENGRICVGLWRHRAWIALNTQAFAPADGQALAALSAQMLARLDPPMTTGTLYIAGADKPFAVPMSEGWTVQWLTPEIIASAPTIRTEAA